MDGGAYPYMLRCADGSYYVGTAREGVEKRLAEHNAGTFGGCTSKRRPVSLIFSQHFPLIAEAIAAERQVKGWTRSKKEALIHGDWSRISALAHRRSAHPSRRAASPRSSG